jgi:hypothetical protein
MDILNRIDSALPAAMMFSLQKFDMSRREAE